MMDGTMPTPSRDSPEMFVQNRGPGGPAPTTGEPPAPISRGCCTPRRVRERRDEPPRRISSGCNPDQKIFSRVGISWCAKFLTAKIVVRAAV